jgi:hypothetical protein
MSDALHIARDEALGLPGDLGEIELLLWGFEA